MSGKVRALEECREALMQIRKQQAVLEDYMRVPYGEADSSMQRDMEAALFAARKEYRTAVAVSIGLMEEVSEAQRKVLWRFYVLGMSNSQVARDMHYAIRSVKQMKSAGLNRLRGVEE